MASDSMQERLCKRISSLEAENRRLREVVIGGIELVNLLQAFSVNRQNNKKEWLTKAKAALGE